MEVALNQGIYADIETRIMTALSVFKFSNIEKALSCMLENLKEDNPVNYVGELNRYDVMH
jgi:hypothetical protein